MKKLMNMFNEGIRDGFIPMMTWAITMLIITGVLFVRGILAGGFPPVTDVLLWAATGIGFAIVLKLWCAIYIKIIDSFVKHNNGKKSSKM